MKNILLILAIAFSTVSFAQGNLQFNQVKLVSALETVPVGKVWKVESILPTNNFVLSFNGAPLFYLIEVNGNSRTYGNSAWNDDASNSTAGLSFINTPIWLPEGTTLAAGSNVGEISVIEFNIVP